MSEENQPPPPKRYSYAIHHVLHHSYHHTSKHSTTTSLSAHPYRHCPSTVQVAHSASQDVPGTGTTASGGQGDSLHGTTGVCYPNMLGCNRLIFDSVEVDYSCVSKVIVSTNNNDSQLPLEGEELLTFTGITILQSWNDIQIMFADPSVSILNDPSIITCSEADLNDVSRAKELLSTLTRLGSGTKPHFVPNFGPGDTGDGDSSDEDVPLTHDRPLLFTPGELHTIQLSLERVWKHYHRAVSGHFSNGPGKFFMCYLAEYFGCASASTSTRFESSLSTTSGGSGSIGEMDTQTGSSMITAYTINKQDTRQARLRRFVRHSHIKRYSDVSTYDHLNGIFITAGEIKSTIDAANSQNLEQMLGLWRSTQKFMLGWSINPEHINCRILVKDDQASLHLYQLQETNNISSIRHLAELYLACILLVDST